MFMIYAAYALAFWHGIHLFARGEVQSSGRVITTLFSIIIGTNAFSQLEGYMGGSLRNFTAGGELLKVIDDEALHASKTSQESRPAKNTDITGNITFSIISFRYPLRPSVPVLRNFSLTLSAAKWPP
jgi:ATP-binding cassette, subfamily B (MDR/TAP), member 1